MKTSYYNFVLENGDQYILYNVGSDEIIILHPELYELYISNIGCVDKLK